MATYSPDYTATLGAANMRQRLAPPSPEAGMEARRAQGNSLLQTPGGDRMAQRLAQRLRVPQQAPTQQAPVSPLQTPAPPSSPMTASAPAATPTAPVQGADASGGTYGNYAALLAGRLKGKGTGAQAARRAMLQMRLGLAAQRLPQLQGAIDQLLAQSDPSQLATTYAGDFERQNDQFQRAEGQLDQLLASRGLTESSMGGAAFGQLAAGQAQATSGLQNAIGQEARQRGDMARELLYRLFTGETSGAAGLAGDMRDDYYRQQELDNQPGWLENLLPSAMSAAGTYYGMKK